MKSELDNWGATVGAAVLGCLFGGLVLAIFPGWSTVGEWLKTEYSAAWVQAIGSVVAILVAIAVPAFSDRAKEKRDSEAKKVKAMIVAVGVQVKVRCIRDAIEKQRNLINAYSNSESGIDHACKMNDAVARLTWPSQAEMMTLGDHIPQLAMDLVRGFELLMRHQLLINIPMGPDGWSNNAYEEVINTHKSIFNEADAAYASSDKALDLMLNVSHALP
jgi:hypothetical protein